MNMRANDLRLLGAAFGMTILAVVVVGWFLFDSQTECEPGIDILVEPENRAVALHPTDEERPRELPANGKRQLMDRLSFLKVRILDHGLGLGRGQQYIQLKSKQGSVYRAPVRALEMELRLPARMHVPYDVSLQLSSHSVPIDPIRVSQESGEVEISLPKQVRIPLAPFSHKGASEAAEIPSSCGFATEDPGSDLLGR